MIQLMVGWVKNLFNYSKVEEFTLVEEVTPSRMGFHFEHDELKRLMVRLKGFEIRNYLAKYTKSTKRTYQEGYIAVFK